MRISRRVLARGTSALRLLFGLKQMQRIKGSMIRELYKKRNEIERFFRGLKAFKAVFTCYDKLDIMFASFATIIILLPCLNTT